MQDRVCSPLDLPRPSGFLTRHDALSTPQGLVPARAGLEDSPTQHRPVRCPPLALLPLILLLAPVLNALVGDREREREREAVCFVPAGWGDGVDGGKERK